MTLSAQTAIIMPRSFQMSLRERYKQSIHTNNTINRVFNLVIVDITFWTRYRCYHRSLSSPSVGKYRQRNQNNKRQNTKKTNITSALKVSNTNVRDKTRSTETHDMREQTELLIPWTCPPQEDLPTDLCLCIYTLAVHHQEVLLGSSILVSDH